MERAVLYRFDRFELDPVHRVLRADDRPVPLGPRAFDVLEMLVRNHDRLVSKDEIMEHVWRGIIVEENNLPVQISQLRKVLGDHARGQPLIATVAGHGYRFSAPVERIEPPASATPLRSSGGDVMLAEAAPAAAGAASLALDKKDDAAERAPVARRRVVVALAVVCGIAILGGAIAIGLRGPFPAGLRGLAPPRLSIVVLPFRNFSDDSQQGYVAESLSDDLTTDLARLPASFVIARESANAYRDKPVTAQQVGQELGVRYMLEGSVRPSEDRVVINAQLIDTGNGAHLWAERFETSRAGIAAAQTEIVGRITAALDMKLVQVESRRSIKERPDDPDALDLFFRARSSLDRDRSLEGMGAAQPLLERAIALQPDFLDALDELAWLLLRRIADFDDPDQDADLAEAARLVDRALKIEPHDPRALVNKGKLSLDTSCPDAISSFQLALTLEPSNVGARDGIGLCGTELGHPEEMVKAMREALALSPQDPEMQDRQGHLGMALLLLDQPAEAAEWLTRAGAGRAAPVERYERGLIEAAAMLGRVDEARRRYVDYNRIWPHRSVWRESCYMSKAQSKIPAMSRVLAGLAAAGMPQFASETVDSGVPPTSSLRLADYYEPTPVGVPDARTVSTAELAAMLSGAVAPLVVDVGCGEGVIPGALFLPWVEDGARLDDAIQPRLARELAGRLGDDRDRPIVVMGSGVYGWGPYNTVLRLLALGYRNVAWYRGGEEAWAAAKLPSEDRRVP